VRLAARTLPMAFARLRLAARNLPMAFARLRLAARNLPMAFARLRLAARNLPMAFARLRLAARSLHARRVAVHVERAPAQESDQCDARALRERDRERRRGGDTRDDGNPRRQRLLHDLERDAPRHEQRVPRERPPPSGEGPPEHLV